MVRFPLSALLVALFFSAGFAHASGVERGSTPTDVSTTMGVPVKVQTEAEQAIRGRCDLKGVDHVYAQDFTTDVVFDSSGIYNTRYVIEYTVYFAGTSALKSIVVDATVISASGKVVVNNLHSPLCQ